MPESPTAPTSDTSTRTPLSDKEAGFNVMATLFPSLVEDTNETAATDAPEPEAGESAEDEEQPVEVEAQAETETEESEDAEQPSEQPQAQPRTFRVKLEDVEEEVTEEELLKGYMRQSDYTRKRQEDAAKAKELEAEKERTRLFNEQYAQRLAEIETALKPQEPDWEKIKTDNPEGFPAIYAQYQLQEKQYESVRQERAKAEAEVQKQRAETLLKMLTEEREKLHTKLPELKQPETAKQLASYLRETYGFTDEEIAGTTRHELLVMARKAQLYDEAQKVKPKIVEQVEQKIKPAKPGAASSTKPKPTELERDIARLRKTGSEQDLAKVLGRVLK